MKIAIEKLKTRSDDFSKRRREKVELYLEGLNSRLLQIDYCLKQFDQLNATSIESTSSTDEYFGSDKIAEFYCDSFWTWVYSALDILAQVVNQTEDLKIKEKDVSFNSVLKILRKLTPKPGCLSVIEALAKSHLRSRMVSYRNCANHRRPICLFHDVRTQTMTSGYKTATGPAKQIVRYICDHSVAFTPDPKKKKELISHCKKDRDQLQRTLKSVLNKLAL
ncbi:MAG: Cthe_2314 family HEPN domain-containing protein [Planctomycetota bacterium]|nr:Cthe_2314 family HEPN domain-containing protein [Planctomycetota bacterium]